MIHKKIATAGSVASENILDIIQVQGTKKISFYRAPITETNPRFSLSLSDIHQKIIGDNYKSATERIRSYIEKKERDIIKKRQLDYVTFNGEFTLRYDKGFVSASGFFCLDIDHIANVQVIKDRLISDKNIQPVLIFRSPSGDGLKVVVQIDPPIIDLQAPKNKMQNIWKPVNEYFRRNYSDIIIPKKGVEFIDGACKDLSRACFLCHDPECYINEDAGVVLDHSFIAEYTPAVVEKKHSKKVSVRTSLNNLNQRHCSTGDNHHPELRSLAAAAMTIGETPETTKTFIHGQVEISPESSYHNNPAAVDGLVDDLFNRYGQDTPGVIKLTPLSFAYGILLFKYAKEVKEYVLAGLYYEGVRQLLQDFGFYKRYVAKDKAILIKADGAVIKEVSTENLRDAVTGYVDSIAENVSFVFQGNSYIIPKDAIRETYLKQSNNIFNKVWLEHVSEHTVPVLRDSATTVYIPFQNQIAVITKDSVEEMPITDLKDMCIWQEQLNNRPFAYTNENEQCEFTRFLRNVTSNNPQRYFSFVTAIGYLLHHHFKASEGQIVIFYDEAITDTKKPMGGTGKGLIANALKQVRAVVKIDGKHMDTGNRFWKELITAGTQIVWMDDTKADFDFSVLHSAATDGLTIERKFLPQIFIEPKDSPKMLICSNSIIACEGTTNIRRQFVLELSSHYSKQIIRGNEKPIETEHGGLFFSDDWDADQWNMFYSFMCDCVCHYLQNGLVPFTPINAGFNRLRQITNEDFAEWVEEQQYQPNTRYLTKDHFTAFVSKFYGDDSRFGQRTFTNWIKLYADFKGWGREIVSANGLQYFLFTPKSG